MEYSESVIERSLKIWGFDYDNIEISKIRHVPMHDWKISTNSKPLLYIDNLQCCIGLYAYGNGFSFAAHINTVVFRNDEYILDKNKNPIYCNRCNNLFNSILQNKTIVTEPYKIGITIGRTPLAEDEKSITLIHDGIKDVINKLKHLGIDAIQVENIYAPEFILDSINENLILVNNNKTKRK